MLSFYVKFWTDRQKDRQTDTVKSICPQSFHEGHKNSDRSKIEINVAQKLKFVYGMVENIVEKGENAGYQHFLLFPQCF